MREFTIRSEVLPAARATATGDFGERELMMMHGEDRLRCAAYAVCWWSMATVERHRRIAADGETSPPSYAAAEVVKNVIV